MAEEDTSGGYTPGRATRFYVPLLIQTFSQCLTYPLVAAIVSRGPMGIDVLTAFAQGQTVMFLIGAVGSGLVMTGMVFARSVAGYRNFIRFNAYMMLCLLAVQAICGLPPFDRLIFQDLLNLPAEMASIARDTLLWGIPLQATFFTRNVPLVILFNARASSAANNATFVRILLTVVATYLFVHMGWTGAMWGLAAMTVPCFAELLLTYVFSRPHVRVLREDPGAEPISSQFRFTVPLSLGGVLLAAAPFMVATFVGRTENAVEMLAIHYVTIGLANAVGFAALRFQAVSIQFPPEYAGDHRIMRYAICAGIVLGAVILLSAIPAVDDWYFHVVQGLPVADLGKVRIVMAIYAAWPVLQTIRGHAEGIAAVERMPAAVMAGQIAYLVMLVATLALALKAGMQGWLMGAIAILVATAATIVSIYGTLGWMKVRSSSRRCPAPTSRTRH